MSSHYPWTGMERIVRDLGLISIIIPLPQHLGMKEAYSMHDMSSTFLALWGPVAICFQPTIKA